MGKMLKAKEVAEILKLSESTVYKLLRENQIPGFKIGESWRFDSDEIDALIAKAKEKNKQKSGEK